MVRKSHLSPVAGAAPENPVESLTPLGREIVQQRRVVTGAAEVNIATALSATPAHGAGVLVMETAFNPTWKQYDQKAA